MLRPARSRAWPLIAGPHGRFRLVTTSDAERSWAARPLPCPPGERAGQQLSAAGPRSLWLVCEGTPGAGSVPGALYRSTDGGRRWTRIAAENSLDVYAVSDRVGWAVRGYPSGSVVVRTTDGGRTWRTVLSRTATRVEAFGAEGLDCARAVALVFTASGERFAAYRTLRRGQDLAARWALRLSAAAAGRATPEAFRLGNGGPPGSVTPRRALH